MFTQCKKNRGRLPALRCALLTADGGSFAVPDDSVCQLLLLVCGLFEKALQTCAFSFPLFRIPATLVGRLARSTSCVISVVDRYSFLSETSLKRGDLPLCGSVKYGQRGVGFDRGES